MQPIFCICGQVRANLVQDFCMVAIQQGGICLPHKGEVDQFPVKRGQGQGFKLQKRPRGVCNFGRADQNKGFQPDTVSTGR